MGSTLLWVGLTVISVWKMQVKSVNTCVERSVKDTSGFIFFGWARDLLWIGMAWIGLISHHALWLFKSNDSLNDSMLPGNRTIVALFTYKTTLACLQIKPRNQCFKCLTSLWFTRAHGKIIAPCPIGQELSCLGNGKNGSGWRFQLK